MKTPSLLRFVCLVCAWTSSLAEYVQVQRAPGVRAPGIEGCLPSPVYTVRLQSLKTSGGSVYTRQLVTTADLPCFSTSTTLDATTIDNCAEATAKKGLNSFSWENGACTAYLTWLPQKRAACKDGGSKVVYVVKTPLTPVGEGKIIVSGEINDDDPTKVFLNISHQYDSCGSSTNEHKGYKLLINGNGSHVVMLPEGNTTYRLDQRLLCFGSVNISLWSVGADGKVNSNEVQVAYTGVIGINYYRLTTGGCVYHSRQYGDYLAALQYCNSIDGASLYFATVDGGASAFLAALKEVGFPNGAGGFFVGLRWVALGQWKWIGGLSQPGNDTIWTRGSPTGQFDCATAYQFKEGWRLIPRGGCDGQDSIVCYFPNP